MHPLDNVIWHALNTRQKHLARSCDHAATFLPEISLLSGFEDSSDAGYASLSRLFPTGSTAGVFLPEPYQPRPGWTYVGGAPILEMVCDNGTGDQSASDPAPPFQELGDADSPDMVELATLTKPGPFNTRTHELGLFLGFRQNGNLVAMAGERLKVPGFTEVSGVCTHPDHLGKGYARALMSEVMRRIRLRGEVPFLHVREDNARAIELYRRLGFRERVLLHYAILQRE